MSNNFVRSSLRLLVRLRRWHELGRGYVDGCPCELGREIVRRRGFQDRLRGRCWTEGDGGKEAFKEGKVSNWEEGEKAKRAAKTNADEITLHSKASHAVLTAPPPDSDAIIITPGAQTLDSNALIKPASHQVSE